MEQQANKQFIYVANIGGGASYRHMRAVATLVFETEGDGFRMGWALCQPGDSYSETIGKRLARRRLAYAKQMGVPVISQALFKTPQGQLNLEQWFDAITKEDVQPEVKDLAVLNLADVISPDFMRCETKATQKLEIIAMREGVRQATASVKLNRDHLVKTGIAPHFNEDALPALSQKSLDRAYDEVSKTNLAFLNQAGEPGEVTPISDLFAGYVFSKKDTLKKQIGMVEEEIGQEMSDSENVHQVRDALCDAGVFLLGAYHYLGMKPMLEEIEPSDMVLDWVEVSEALQSQLKYLLDSLEAVENEGGRYSSFLVADFYDSLNVMLSLIIAAYRNTGYNFWLDMSAVYESNMSKFVDTVEEAQAAKASYAEKGIEVDVVFNSLIQKFFVNSAKDQTVNGKDYPKGKFLKCLGFFEPRFVR